MLHKAYPFFRYTLGFSFFNRPDKVIGFENIPKKGPFIVAANHISHLDHFFIAAKVIERTDQKVYFIAKPRYWQWPGAQKAANYLGAIVYNQDDKENCLQPAIDLLKKGGIVALFPEGTRNFDPELLLGHTGVARLVLGVKVPVIPVGYYGPHTYSLLDSLQHLFWLEKKIKIIFGRPLYLNQYYDKPIDKKLLREVTAVIMKAVGQLCGKKYPYHLF